MKDSSPYTPISCDYYDLLEISAMRQQISEFAYWDEEGKKQSTQARIQELYARDGEEYLVLSTGLRFRLDRLIRMDDHVVPLPGSEGYSCLIR